MHDLHHRWGGGGHRLPGALLDIEKGTYKIFPRNVGDGKGGGGGGRKNFPSYYTEIACFLPNFFENIEISKQKGHP